MPLIKNIWRKDLTEEELNEAEKKLKEWITEPKGKNKNESDN